MPHLRGPSGGAGEDDLLDVPGALDEVGHAGGRLDGSDPRGDQQHRLAHQEAPEARGTGPRGDGGQLAA
eukprot:scaffold681421_cov59-Prasinocladus_malaysianus.AAC.1